MKDVCVDHGGFDIFMAEKFLDGADIVSVLKQVCGIGWKGGALFLAEHVSAQPPPNRTGKFPCIRLSNIASLKILHGNDDETGDNFGKEAQFSVPCLIAQHAPFPLIPVLHLPDDWDGVRTGLLRLRRNFHSAFQP